MTLTVDDWDDFKVDSERVGSADWGMDELPEEEGERRALTFIEGINGIFE